ncbi:hypothetical protein Dip510_001939 [Elusimicrobium posterum]|uniref:head-tail connector protein n=1 Tax=Elusimicrobium posterum TaxID=3116653 RepID=UPI003C715E4E
MSLLLTTLQETKLYLKIDNDAQDELLTALIESLSSAMETYLGRFIIERNITDEPHYLEQDSRFINLDFYPVTEIYEISEDCEKTDLAKIKIDKQNGIIKKVYGRWGEAVLVSYKAGLAADTAAVPKDIKLAVWNWIGAIMSKNDGSIKAESLGDYSVTYNSEEFAMPPLCESLLENYRRHNV